MAQIEHKICSNY